MYTSQAISIAEASCAASPPIASMYAPGSSMAPQTLPANDCGPTRRPTTKFAICHTRIGPTVDAQSACRRASQQQQQPMRCERRAQHSRSATLGVSCPIWRFCTIAPLFVYWSVGYASRRKKFNKSDALSENKLINFLKTRRLRRRSSKQRKSLFYLLSRNNIPTCTCM